MKALGSSASLRLSAKNPPSRLLAKMPSPRLLAKDHPRWPRGLIKEAKALLVIDLTQESCEAPLLEKGELLERMPHRFLKPTKGILKKSSEPGGSQPLKKTLCCLGRGKTLGLRFSKDTKLWGACVGASKCKKKTPKQKLSLKTALGYDWEEQLTEEIDRQAASALRRAFEKRGVTDEAYKAQKSQLTAGALLSLLASEGIDTDWST